MSQRKHKMRGSFKKRINDVTVEGFYDGYPPGFSITRERNCGPQQLGVSGAEDLRDLIYALQAALADYEDVP